MTKYGLLLKRVGQGVLMSDEAKLPLPSRELVLISLLSVCSEGERFALPRKDQLPRMANGSLVYGHIKFN